MRIKDIEQLPGKVIEKALWLDDESHEGIAVLFTDGDFIFVSEKIGVSEDDTGALYEYANGVQVEGEVGKNRWRIKFQGLREEEIAFFREEE